MWDNALCDEGKTSPTNAAQVPQSAPVGEQNQTLEQDHAWHRAAALARQLSSVRAELDDAWIAGSGVVDALAGEISAFQAELDTVPIVGSKPGQPTEPETKHRQALDQERERAGALARELNSLRAKLDAAWIVGSEAVEAAEAEVKQTLEQERRRADALARELGSVHAELDAARIARQKAAQTGTAEAEQKQALKQERDQAEAVARELTSVRAELDMARAAGLEAARTAEATKIGQEQAFKQESDKTEKLALELASARKEAEANSVLLAAARAEVLEATEKNKAIAAEQSPALASEHDRAETLARELTSVRAELDTARASGQEAARSAEAAKQSAEAAKIGQERALKEERDKTERLTRELASARKEAEARSALLAAAHAEVLQAMQTGEAAAAEQKLALARERDRADPLARELASVRNELEAANRQIAALNAHAVASCQLTVDSSELRMAEPSSRTAEDKAPRPQQISGEAVASIPGPSSASELPRPEPQSTAPEAASDSDPKVAMRTERSTSESAASRPSADEQRLLARANALLRQAEISSARPLLERALERGSARAAFMLAETYDARVLQSWRVRGISGDPAKARELYERAQAGGIEDAKERIRTLQ
jgi:DNA repair exonuclease SbcCD ATPase subunit